MAHRQELLEQAREKLKRANPGLNVGIEQARRRASTQDEVVVASVQTLRGSRLRSFDPNDFEAVVCDEAHHSVARSYLKVFEHFRVFEEDGPLLLGFTATPFRGDKRGLGEVYQEIVFQRCLREMIDAGWLCRIAAFQALTFVSLDCVKSRMGDFVEEELSLAVNTPERNELILKGEAFWEEGLDLLR